ncbi:ABC transporter ATP-binding protein [uncultured Mucilaginibacter sp.]|uniref:ABC transporter ATP-binding protein n=1 Tax=uncultured Mucilaginibacter sp. TaxID=797541 RepID=UPI0025D50ACA|nr:ABC transporter ATP-binding protein [uncultured Mucilaginibacter sp.]
MVIKTENLNFYFGNQPVIKSLALQVPEGSIFGFLGPNGAGKTTTIKLLLNLLKLQEGSISIFGRELLGNRLEILRQIGSLIEQPAIYTHLTGRENLINRARLLEVPVNRADDMLKLVGLNDAGLKKAGNYSLGMKQRLGIGLALLANPKLLILDEPTNGLDPNGIIEVRELLIKLAKEEGKTVFVSSHMLAEVERMATHVGIINGGELVFQGSIQDLESISQPMVQVETDNTADAANYLKRNGYEIGHVTHSFITLPFTSKDDTATINAALHNNGHRVYSIGKVQKDLEQLFLNITQKSST